LNDKLDSWDAAQLPLLNSSVNKYKHLMTRVDMNAVTKMIEESKEEAQAGAALTQGTVTNTADGPECLENEPLVTEKISIDDFTKVDLRIARIVEASEVKEARKLLQLKLHLGGEKYLNVFAGIKAAYEPEKLIGKLVVCVANLEPRQMKFGLSEGMVVAAGGGGPEVFLLTPDDGAKPGMRLH
jgi:methionyl-tRNA synthetase